MQIRLGPNRVGPWGLLQPIADGVKLFLKEIIVPTNASPLLYIVAPMMAITRPEPLRIMAGTKARAMSTLCSTQLRYWLS